MTLTQKQYILIMDLAETLPGIFRGNDSEDSPEQSRSGTPAGTQTPADVEQPQAISSMTFDFAIPLIRLEVFGAKAVDSATLASDSIAAFAINTSDVSYKSPGDGSSEVSITVQSISMSNTRPGKSVYREIIPLAKRSGNQL
jgi:vacuolar protein sorting-associated protein 13A/C